ncbi:YL1-domain-containing protein [Testicularia cyperi]|uniref:YL1-domain-containing protein n=1 Tax=Testicularia cyperi TaxID=1882483 RepID=A0A317XKR1_9BASI|nr:YL1-domain-containing protein [Testicularia cyperi]
MRRSSSRASSLAEGGSSDGGAGSSQAEQQRESSYRIERIGPLSSGSDLMITGRAKRSTAGNRLKALLDQELEKDDVFAEVENDVDFHADENDGIDIVDSDFDRDSDDNDQNAEDDSEGERELQQLEKVEKQKKRAANRAVGVVKRPIAPPRPARKQAATSASNTTASEKVGERESKRRRISFAPDHTQTSGDASSSLASSTGSPSATGTTPGRRTSSRSATVQSKMQIESRLEEAEQRRAALPTRPQPKKKAKLTQDALIAEALEVEEENRESLRKFLEQEEERRAKQRQRKERITGPYLRWVTVGLKTKVIEDASPVNSTAESTKSLAEAGKGREQADAQDAGLKASTTHTGKVSDNFPKETVSAALTNTTTLAASEGKPTLANQVSTTSDVAMQDAAGDNTTPDIAMQDTAGNDSSKPTEAPTLAEEKHDSTSTLNDGIATPPLPPKEMPARTPEPESAPTSSDAINSRHGESGAQSGNNHAKVADGASDVSVSGGGKVIPTSNAVSTSDQASVASLTLDPVLEARKRAAELRSGATAATSSSVVSASKDTDKKSENKSSSSDLGASGKEKQEKFEKQARTLLSIERMPEDWEWLDEFNAILGDHVDWESVPVVASRNRPLRPRQSICPITGLPALYKDPRTGIPYANAFAYQVITKLLDNQYVWTGGRYEASRSQRDNEKQNDKSRGRRKRQLSADQDPAMSLLGRAAKKLAVVKGAGARAGAVGAGAVPPAMGIYVDHEDEAGPGGVWKTARERASTLRPAFSSRNAGDLENTEEMGTSETLTPHKPGTSKGSSASAIQGGGGGGGGGSSKRGRRQSSHSLSRSDTARGDEKRTRCSSSPKPSQSQSPAPAAGAETPTPTPKAKPKAKAKAKPRFEVVLTNALAPGDEASVMAAALSLPPGSTRSGRRVQRPA